MSICCPSHSLAVELRVRYAECDPQNLAHHSAYAVWFELARTEWLRRLGLPYRQLECQGIRFVVARLEVRFRQPARYDDVLSVGVRMRLLRGPKLDHAYSVHRGRALVATGSTTLVCVGDQDRLQPVPGQVLERLQAVGS